MSGDQPSQLQLFRDLAPEMPKNMPPRSKSGDFQMKVLSVLEAMAPADKVVMRNKVRKEA